MQQRSCFAEVVTLSLPDLGAVSLGMQRGSEVWVWTGKDTAFERGKEDSRLTLTLSLSNPNQLIQINLSANTQTLIQSLES